MIVLITAHMKIDAMIKTSDAQVHLEADHSASTVEI
jgi:hypothetical protein